jgi:hypothetical protein
MSEDTTTIAAREFLLLGDGSLLRVVSEDGELIPWARYEARRADATAAGCAARPPRRPVEPWSASPPCGGSHNRHQSHLNQDQLQLTSIDS